MFNFFSVLVLAFFSNSFLLAQNNEVSVPAVTQTVKLKNFPQTKPNPEYSKPTYFEPGEGVLFPEQVFDYDLSSDEGATLKIGNTFLNKKFVQIEIGPLNRWNIKNSKFQSANLSLALKWPKGLFNVPMIEFISKSGEVIWTKKVTLDEMKKWEKEKASYVSTSDAKASDISPSSADFILLEDSSFKKAQRRFAQAFRICLSEKTRKASSRYCSARSIVKNNKLLFSKLVSPPRALVKNEEAPLKGEVNVSPGIVFSFYGELKTGESYEFITEPNKLNLVDVVQVSNDKLKVIGFGIKPIEATSIINKEEYSFLTKLLGFEPTIKEEREFWQLEIPLDSPAIHFPGVGGGIFKQKINTTEIPKAYSRVFLHNNTPSATYLSSVNLKGFKRKGSQVSSEENSVNQEDKNSSFFIWNFKSEKKGEINKSYLNVLYEGKKYSSFFELYRSYANELSARFTGVVSNSGQVIMGEVLYTRWFEKLLGENSFSFQRWGFAGKYFNSLNKLKISSTDSEALSVTTLDLKYRFTPGVWTRDETSGLLMSYQDIKFGDFKSPMLGGGWFWARSMPRVFDDFLNWFPFMRYPKWVDMEVIYYFNSMNANVTLNSPLSVNFHGQMLWSKSVFGEAGFGLKRYAFIDKVLNKKAELNTFYATVGLGIKF